MIKSVRFEGAVTALVQVTPAHDEPEDSYDLTDRGRTLRPNWVKVAWYRDSTGRLELGSMLSVSVSGARVLKSGDLGQEIEFHAFQLPVPHPAWLTQAIEASRPTADGLLNGAQ